MAAWDKCCSAAGSRPLGTTSVDWINECEEATSEAKATKCKFQEPKNDQGAISFLRAWRSEKRVWLKVTADRDQAVIRAGAL